MPEHRSNMNMRHQHEVVGEWGYVPKVNNNIEPLWSSWERREGGRV